MLDNGERISMNNEEAIEYFNIVIEKSNSYEMYLCYMMLDKGNGILMNKKEANRYLHIVLDKNLFVDFYKNSQSLINKVN